jgi:hypothetical protein
MSAKQDCETPTCLRKLKARGSGIEETEPHRITVSVEIVP